MQSLDAWSLTAGACQCLCVSETETQPSSLAPVGTLWIRSVNKHTHTPLKKHRQFPHHCHLLLLTPHPCCAALQVPALLAVGLEGCWGLVLCSFLLPVTTLIKGPDGAPLDDAPAAFRAIWSNVELGGAVYLSIFSIAFFNFFGVSGGWLAVWGQVKMTQCVAEMAVVCCCRTRWKCWRVLDSHCCTHQTGRTCTPGLNYPTAAHVPPPTSPKHHSHLHPQSPSP